MSSSTAGSSHGETVVVGRYRLRTIANNSQYITQEGYAVDQPERKVRAKGYVRPTDESGRSELSTMIKNQVALSNVAAKIEQKRRAAAEAQKTGQTDPPPADVTAKELFLLSCFQNTRLLTDRLHTNNRVYMFKDQMPCSLQTILSNGRLDEDGAFYYFFQLLKAVYYFHENGFVHRNISAVHIYISSNGALLRLGGASSCWNELNKDLDHITATSSRNNTASSSENRRRSPTPQPGSYGICSQCGRDVPIVTEPRPTGGESSGGAGTTSLSSAAPPLNTITTPCRYCGTMQNRMHLLQTIVGTPAFLPPEAIAYQPLQSAMSTGTFNASNGGILGSSTGHHSNGNLHDSDWTGVTDGQSRDMWSCGVVLYFMLTCRLPFDPRVNGTSIGSRLGDGAKANSIDAYGGGGAELTLTPQQTWEMCNRIAAVEYTIPPYVPDNARAVVEALLVRDPKRRPTAESLMQLPCFARLRESGI